MASIIHRRFSDEVISMIGKRVAVETSDKKAYQGDLMGLDERLNVALDNVTGTTEKAFKMILNGSFVKEIRLVEKPFDLKALGERLSRIFPGLVRTREDIGAIIVMEKIKVTEQGIVEGSGLAAERVKAVYDEFIKEVSR